MNLLQRLVNRWSPSSAERGAYYSAVTQRHTDDPGDVLGNPLRNLTPAACARLFEASTHGQWTQLQWLMRHAELLDADLMALIRLRTGAIGEYIWQVQIDKEGDQVLAAEQQAYLQEVYGQMDHLTEAIRHQEMALFRGYGHVAVHDTGPDRWELGPLDTWWFVRDGMYGPWYWNGAAKAVDAQFLGDENRIDPTRFIIREESTPLIWLACVKFVRANFSQKWWDAFCEIASQQSTIIVGPTGLSTEEADRFIADATAIARGGSGVLPGGSTVQWANALRGDAPYPEHMSKLTRDLVKAAIGGTLAIETQSGSGTLAGEAHQQTLRTIMAGSAREITAVMQRQFDRPRLAEKWPGRPRLARWELTAREESDQGKKIDDIAKLAGSGYQVDPEQVTDETGYRVTLRPLAPAPLLTNRGPQQHPAGWTPTAQPSSSAVKKLALELEVPTSWLEPVAELLAELEGGGESLTLAELDSWAERATAALPEIFEALDAEALAELLERALGAAVVTTLEESP